MTAKLFNIARMTTTTTGTGTVTLGSAVSSYLTFALAGIADGDTVSYVITEGNNREVGRGVYSVAGTSLTRGPLKSTNADAAISLMGAAQVAITAVKEDFFLVDPAVMTWDDTLKRLDLNISGGAVFAAENGTQFVLTGTDGVATTAFWYSFNAACAIDFMHASGTRAARTSTATGATMGQINYQGYDTVTATNDGYSKAIRVRAVAAPSGATWTDTDHGADLAFFTTAPGTTTLSEKFRFKGDGHFLVEGVTSTGATGTGKLVFDTAPTFTTSITAPLVIGGTAAGSSLTLRTTSGAGTTDSIIFQSGSQVTSGVMNTSGQWSMGPGLLTTVATNVILLLNKNAAAPITPVTGTLLHVVGVDTGKTNICFDGFGTSAFSGFNFRSARGTCASPTASSSGDNLGFFQFSGYNSNAGAFANFVSASGASILGVAAETWSGATTYGAHIDVKTTPTSAGQTAVVMARFNASGGFSVGTTSDPGIGLIYTNSASFMSRSKTSWTNGAGVGAGTITTAPSSGNPTKWIPVDDNGTTRYIPAW